MASPVETGRKSVPLKVLRAEQPYEAVLLECKFPSQEEDLRIVSGLVGRMVAAASQGRKMNMEAFIQCNPLAAIEQSARLADHAREWQPIMGLGIWPDREPPTSWTKGDFMKLVPGTRPRVTTYKICRISASGSARDQAWTGLLGTGAVIVVLTSDDTSAFLKKTKDVLLHPVTDEFFRHASFYVPLLERKSFDSVRPEQLESWFCGASFYVRESTEDQGILISSRDPFKPLLEKLGGTLKAGPNPEWQVPC